MPPSFGIASGIDIPAGGRHTLFDTFTLPVDVEAYRRARARARAGADHDDDRAAAGQVAARPACDRQRWDPRWRDRICFDEPVTLPKGTVLRWRSTYYNSIGESEERCVAAPRQ